MDEVDRNIANLIQSNGKASSAEIAHAVGVSVSTANERVRRLFSSGVVKEWRAVLDSKRLGANLCALVLLDMDYDGEEETTKILKSFTEIQEIHHISGAHSYMLKIRVADTDALQKFLRDKVKPLRSITATESIIVLETLKETSEILISNKSS